MKHECEKKKCPGMSRRRFLKSVSGMAGSALVMTYCSQNSDNSTDPVEQILGPRTGVANPYVTNSGNPILISVNGTDFTTMLRAGMEALGGFGLLVTDRDVLIKPNLNHNDPYPGISSPDTIATIIREVNAATAGTVYAGDMGHYTTVYNYLRLEDYVNDAGGTLLNFSNVHNVRQNFWESSKPNFSVYTDVYDAPVIISTCCLKRHFWSSLTCAIKCMVGCVRGPNASDTRDYLHYRSSNFMTELAEIAGLINPELTIVDARSILIEDGPMIQDGTVVDGVNRLIICGDIVATDIYCAQIMESYDSTFSFSSIQETLQRAHELGLGVSNLNQVEIIEVNT